MIREILAAAGLPHMAARFPDPPDETYAVYLEDVDADGADGANLLRIYDATVELYAPTRAGATASAAALEAELDRRGIPWTCQSWYWLQDVQRYQAVYEFTLYDKRRPSP